MEDITRLRKRIDEVDEQILHSLSERVNICRSIGVVKKKHKIPIKDIPRENDVYMHIKEKAATLGLDPEQVEAIYNRIVKMCSSVQ
ncbi:chorismate mutase [Candidatus Bathyarchaeota archaeon A05DMB-2]|jgi:chorismate mutase/prephenate dehydratase|nr:chorismate mutase [Candidatus Bathyarchaeota archaeon A05DMB-2]